MARYTTFRYRLDPTVEQQAVLWRHAGAARFAFNHCLLVRILEDLLIMRAREADASLAERHFEGEQCGAVIDRDLDAATNLAVWAEQPPPS